MPTDPGNFGVKAEEGMRPCSWDSRDTMEAVYYLTAVGQDKRFLKPQSSLEDNISENLPGQRAERAPTRGSGFSGRQEPISPVVTGDA